MTIKQLLSGMFLAGVVFTMSAQTNIATSTLTSRGWNAGTLGTGNTFYGSGAGETILATGTGNTFLGAGAGNQTLSGDGNIAIGTYAGVSNQTGNNNIFIGNGSGCEDNGEFSGCIYIGSQAGFTECASNRLVIDHGETTTPLIWGDFAADLVKLNAKVGIGLGTAAFPTATGEINVSGYKLFVKGGILTEEVRVKLATGWADYVFEDNYALKPLEEVECFIAENGHLPNVPSAKQVAEEGIELGDMARIQQEKIEELTLYAIQQQKQLDKQDAEIKVLKAMVRELLEKKQ